jgi:benzoyl-CoA reductase subunit C
LDALAGGLTALPACSTLNSPLEDRRAVLLRAVRACGAGGVLFNVIKFCEPELFYLPSLRASLREEGVPSLFLEQEVPVDLSGQARTRIEAFAEMIGSRGG